MTFRLIIVAVLLASVSGAQSAARNAPSATKKSNNAAAKSSVPDPAIRKLMDDEWAAWGTMDTAKVARFYDHNPNLIFFDIAPLKYYGWSEYEAGVKKVLAAYKSLNFRIHDDARIWQRGDGALAVATVHMDAVQADGKPETADLRWTVVMERKNRDWKVVHEHVSIPAPQ